MKKAVLVSENDAFQRKYGALARRAGLKTLTFQSIAEVSEAMLHHMNHVVIVEDTDSKDGAFSSVSSLFESVHYYTDRNKEFYEPDHVVVISDSPQTWSATLDDKVEVYRTPEESGLFNRLLKIAAV